MAAGLSAGAHVWVCIARQDGRSKQAGRQAESLAYLGTGSRAVPSPPQGVHGDGFGCGETT